MIEYRGVHKTFDVPVLSGVDLVVHEGETFSIVGPSGTGKSVLLKTTIGLITPDLGEVFIDGQAVYSQEPGVLEGIRRKVRYVFQYAALFDSMNVLDNVAMGLPETAEKSLGRAEILRRVCASLEMVNLDPHLVLRKLPAELSGGMRKRVGLARAIVAEPGIILYDEPVTGLDPVNAATVNGLIISIAQRTKVTSIVVTHDIDGALEMSDRVALLDRGKLRFVGTPTEFRQCPDLTVRAFADRRVAAEVAMGLVNDEPLPTRVDENGDDE